MGNALGSYDKLIAHHKKTALLSSCASVLGWDRETYMPANAGVHRAEQLTLLSGIAHERAIDPNVGEWLVDCERSHLTDDSLGIGCNTFSFQFMRLRVVALIYWNLAC